MRVYICDRCERKIEGDRIELHVEWPVKDPGAEWFDLCNHCNYRFKQALEAWAKREGQFA